MRWGFTYFYNKSFVWLETEKLTRCIQNSKLYSQWWTMTCCIKAPVLFVQPKVHIRCLISCRNVNKQTFHLSWSKVSQSFWIRVTLSAIIIITNRDLSWLVFKSFNENIVILFEAIFSRKELLKEFVEPGPLIAWEMLSRGLAIKIGLISL